MQRKKVAGAKRETGTAGFVSAMVPEALQRPVADSVLGPLVEFSGRGPGDHEKGGAPVYRDALPWAAFAEVWTEAACHLACLEHSLASCELRPYWICRMDFQTSAAIASLGGDPVVMQDLVLVDADMAPRRPSTSWTMAKALLGLRRHIARTGLLDILTVEGILDLETRLLAALAAAPVLHKPMEPAFQRRRLELWLKVVEDLRASPALPAVAIALSSWRSIRPLATGNEEIGLLLSSVLLWQWGKTRGLTVCSIVGLQSAAPMGDGFGLDDRETLGAWIAQFCRTVGVSAIAGQDSLKQMNRALARATNVMKRHRSNSRIPQLIRLLLSYPAMTTRFASQRLRMSVQGTDCLMKELLAEGVVVEVSGRTKNRVYQLA